MRDSTCLLQLTQPAAGQSGAASHTLCMACVHLACQALASLFIAWLHHPKLQRPVPPMQTPTCTVLLACCCLLPTLTTPQLHQADLQAWPVSAHIQPCSPGPWCILQIRSASQLHRPGLVGRPPASSSSARLQQSMQQAQQQQQEPVTLSSPWAASR
jgi:hypothetical protein